MLVVLVVLVAIVVVVEVEVDGGRGSAAVDDDSVGDCGGNKDSDGGNGGGDIARDGGRGGDCGNGVADIDCGDVGVAVLLVVGRRYLAKAFDLTTA